MGKGDDGGIWQKAAGLASHIGQETYRALGYPRRIRNINQYFIRRISF